MQPDFLSLDSITIPFRSSSGSVPINRFTGTLNQRYRVFPYLNMPMCVTYAEMTQTSHFRELPTRTNSCRRGYPVSESSGTYPDAGVI